MDRRQFALGSLFVAAALPSSLRVKASTNDTAEHPSSKPAPGSAFSAKGRPAPSRRTFVSPAVEDEILRLKAAVRNPRLATLIETCYPNTLDTTVHFSNAGNHPDTFVITGDIPAMWLRDSSAQVMPYMHLASRDTRLQDLYRGLMHRQARCILLDSYANAFYATPRKGDFITDRTVMRPGVHERKWEIDSLCYPVRVAFHYWQATGDTTPFDDAWHRAARRIVDTFREQQRLHGDGPYRFARTTTRFYDNAPNSGLGNPTAKIGLIHSAFRPSDDACLLPYLVPSNLFAVVSLRQLQQIAAELYKDRTLAGDAARLADEVEAALQKYAVIDHPRHGRIYAYEIDGFGNALFMDDANVPSLLGLPYLGCCDAADETYRRTRDFVLSPDNPFFFRGSAAEGIGGPHIGPGYIWPLSLIIRAITSSDEAEIETCLRTLIDTTGGTPFMHESFQADNPTDYTRPWFAWCNSLFGELVVRTAAAHPSVLTRI